MGGASHRARGPAGRLSGCCFGVRLGQVVARPAGVVAPWRVSEALLREVLALPDDARAEMAATLLASLDPPSFDDPDEVRVLWAQELERRAKGVMPGEVAGEDWSTVRERLAEDLAG